MSPLPSSSSLSSLEGRTEQEMIKTWPLKVQGRGALSSIPRQSCWVLHVHYCKLPIFASYRQSEGREKLRGGGTTNSCITLLLFLLLLVWAVTRKVRYESKGTLLSCRFNRFTSHSYTVTVNPF